MAVFWIILYTAVNLTSILWLGGLAISAVTGWAVLPAMIGLGAFAVLYSLSNRNVTGPSLLRVTSILAWN